MAQTRARAKQITYKSDATGGSVRSLHDKLGETVSVKDFGAVGDGVTDDTAAIQAADAHAGALGAELFFPAGIYNVSARSTAFAPTATWRGESHRYNQWAAAGNAPPDKATIIEGGAANLDIIAGNLTAIETLNIIFRGSGTGSHISISTGSRMYAVRGCAFYGKEHAVSVSGAVAYILRIESNFMAKQTGDSVYLNWGTGAFNDISVKDNWIFRPDGIGINATGTSGGCTILNIENNSVTDGTGANAAISAVLVQGLRVIANDVEGWGAIYTDPVNLTGKTGYQANARGIQVSGQCIEVSGNVTYGCGSTFSPLRVLSADSVKIGPNRLLKDLSTQAYAISVDAASSNVEIDYQIYDFPVDSIITSGASNIINKANGNVEINNNTQYNDTPTISGTYIKTATETLPNALPTVASASTIASLPAGNVIEITGTTNVDTITETSSKVVIFTFTGVLTMKDTTGNLRLAGDFTTKLGDTLTLLYVAAAGTWREISRTSI